MNFSANIKMYDIKSAFNELDEIDWDWDGNPQKIKKEILFIAMLENHTVRFCIKWK